MLTQVRAENLSPSVFFRRGLGTAARLCSSCCSARTGEQPQRGGREHRGRAAGVATKRLQGVLLLPGARPTGQRRGSERYNRHRDLHLHQPDAGRVVRL